MINVYSFQKMMSSQECPQPKNISKTSHFTFGQNYKKLVANSKASFDFRKFLQRNNQTKKHLVYRQNIKRNPLEQVSSSQGNVQSLLHNKAFKIRCYSKRARQNQPQQDQVTFAKMVKYRAKISQIKQKKHDSTAKKNINTSINPIRMYKLDNYDELQSIALSIKAVYNDFVSESDKHTQKVIILDINYLAYCLKLVSSKSIEKQKDIDYFKRKIILCIKKIVQDKFSNFPLQRTKYLQKPQIIFKVSKQEQITVLKQLFDECEFNSYYCVFSIQTKYAQSLSTYNLMKIHNLAQNIIIVDNQQNFISSIPLINSRHFISLTTFAQKSNPLIALQNLFDSIQNLQIRFAAQQFQNQAQCTTQIVQLPVKRLLQKVKQKRNLKNCKKSSRLNRQRCRSSYENHQYSSFNKKQEANLQNFKQKILKYLKIVGNESNFQSKKSKQLSTNGNNDQFQCMTGRQQNSKTNYQVVSELIRLNANVHKQISNYQKKIEQIQFDHQQKSQQTINYLRFQKIFINIFS